MVRADTRLSAYGMQVLRLQREPLRHTCKRLSDALHGIGPQAARAHRQRAACFSDRSRHVVMLHTPLHDQIALVLAVPPRPVSGQPNQL
eukprot:5644715-Pleurochrysis_carterae.AAC.3